MRIIYWLSFIERFFGAKKSATHRFVSKTQNAVPTSLVVPIDDPTLKHVEVGWTFDHVSDRYRRFPYKEVPVIRFSEDPLRPEEERALFRLTDIHKVRAMCFGHVPRWGVDCTLYLTLDEYEKVIEYSWHIADGASMSLHSFSLLEDEFRAIMGPPTGKNVIGNTVELLWTHDPIESCFSGKIDNLVVSRTFFTRQYIGYETGRMPSIGVAPY